MENLNREAILRMLSGKTGNSSSGGGGGDIDLAGYATSIWVTENFVSIDFFRELFRAYDANSNEILPNDTTSVVSSIKAMVGTWTEQYLTALGNAGGGGGGGGGAQYLNDLLDVQLTTPLTDGQALVYNATLQKWVNGAAGVNMTTVWNALAGSTNEQINASHLSTALSGYVTTSAISDMATQTWVGQQGFATQTWVTSNFITIAYFDRLFRAYNNSTLVSHNDTTSTIDNIKAMFGFWTDFYLSALGTGGVSSVSISLSQLADVNVAGVTNNQFLGYDSTNAEWVNTSLKTINGNSIIGTGDLTIAGVSTLSGLTDVALSSPTTYQVLMYDASSTKWYNSALKTINGQPLYGSGDISVGGGASGNYLPLSGGTLTGTLTINTPSIYPLTLKGSYAYTVLHYLNDSGTHLADAGTQTNSDGTCYYFSLNANGILRIVSLWSSGLYFSRDPTNFKQNLILSNGIIRNIWGHSFNMMNDLNGCIYINANEGGWREGIRIKPNNGWTTILLGGSDLSSDTGTSPNSWSIHNNNGAFYVARNGSALNASASFGNTDGYTWQFNGNVYATGAVTALSDIRHKTVIKDAAVMVEDIARMPAVVYQWNDGREDKELHVGSIAQSWKTVLPEVVLKANDKEGTLSMQYGVAALVSSIIIARKVVNHEDRIKQLEKENKELKERLNIA